MAAHKYTKRTHNVTNIVWTKLSLFLSAAIFDLFLQFALLKSAVILPNGMRRAILCGLDLHSAAAFFTRKFGLCCKNIRPFIFWKKKATYTALLNILIFRGIVWATSQFCKFFFLMGQDWLTFIYFETKWLIYNGKKVCDKFIFLKSKDHDTKLLFIISVLQRQNENQDLIWKLMSWYISHIVNFPHGVFHTCRDVWPRQDDARSLGKRRHVGAKSAYFRAATSPHHFLSQFHLEALFSKHLGQLWNKKLPTPIKSRYFGTMWCLTLISVLTLFELPDDWVGFAKASSSFGRRARSRL